MCFHCNRRVFRLVVFHPVNIECLLTVVIFPTISKLLFLINYSWTMYEIRNLTASANMKWLQNFKLPLGGSHSWRKNPTVVHAINRGIKLISVTCWLPIDTCGVHRVQFSFKYIIHNLIKCKTSESSEVDASSKSPRPRKFYEQKNRGWINIRLSLNSQLCSAAREQYILTASDNKRRTNFTV